MLKAGFSRVDVTPPLGSYMAGYFRVRYAKGVIDPIYLNAIALSDGNETAVIITADFEAVAENYATSIRNKIAESVGIPADKIIIQAIHQHTSIGIFDGELNTAVKNKAYMEVLYSKFCDVARMALDDMSEATLGLAEKQALKQISFIRRFLLKDGDVRANPKSEIAQKIGVVGPIGEPDNTVRLLRFKREGKNDIALVNFSTHPDVIGGEMFCPDWPGYTRTFVEKDIEGVSCILVNGFQGDTNHYDPEDRSKTGLEHSKYMARVITDTVLQIWDKTEPCEDIKVNANVDFVYQMTRTDGVEYCDECVEKLPKLLRGEIPKTALDHVGGPGAAKRIAKMRTGPLFQKAAISVVSLGRIALVGLGGEPFTHYATAMREALPEKYIIAACCANGHAGYLPATTAFKEQGYEPRATPFRETIEEDCVNLAVKLIRSFE